MKKYILAVLAFAITSTAHADPVGYPGSTWGVLTAPSGVIKDTPEDNNWLFQGKATQGVDWVKFGSTKAWVFDTYASVGYSMDRNRLSYNNKVVPAVGIKVVRNFSKGVIEAGVEYEYEHHYGDIYNGADKVGTPVGYKGYGAQAYVSYWFGWNLK